MSGPKREVEMMTCAICGEQKAWRDGFPNRAFAQCWECAWKEHVRAEHKPRKPRALTKAGRIKLLSAENTRLHLDLARLEVGVPPLSRRDAPTALVHSDEGADARPVFPPQHGIVPAASSTESGDSGDET